MWNASGDVVGQRMDKGAGPIWVGSMVLQIF